MTALRSYSLVTERFIRTLNLSIKEVSILLLTLLFFLLRIVLYFPQGLVRLILVCFEVKSISKTSSILSFSVESSSTKKACQQKLLYTKLNQQYTTLRVYKSILYNLKQIDKLGFWSFYYLFSIGNTFLYERRMV